MLESQESFLWFLVMAPFKMADNMFKLTIDSKDVFHIISLEPISESPTLKSFHEPSVKLVRIDEIGTFGRARTGELYH